MKWRNYFWGLFFVIAAVLVIVNQLGFLTGVNVFTLLGSIFLVAILIHSSTHLNFAGILFSFAFLGILYAEPLGIQNLVPWPILIAALLGSIGLSIIFHKSIRNHYAHYSCDNGEHDEHFDQVFDAPDSENINCKVSFGSAIKYVNTPNFEKGYFDCSFGAMKVYFDNAVITSDQAEICLNVSFSGVELYLPKNWNIVDKVNSSLAGIEIKNRPVNPDKTVYLTGKTSFSGVEIIYI